ncbi:MAG: hypothetical protein JO346_01920 [Alphaproteobacteria bacterium]|nr:hypothetical protein [Alphaproteobacteria bacterium]
MPMIPETGEIVHENADAVRPLCDEFEAYIKTKPVRAMLYSLLAGFIFSRLFL